jgi:glycogen debranching enzyme
MTSAGDPEVHVDPALARADGEAAPPLRELEGAPDVPAEARGELLALKSGAVFVCARPDGDVRPARASGEGLYAQDTRHLSELRLTVGGARPVLLSSVMESGHHAVINATNPGLLADGDVMAPQETINVRRTLLIADRLFYRVRVRSFGPEPVATTVEVWLAADFADVFEVRGVERRTSGRLLPPTHEGDRLRFSYVAGDGQRRETLVELEPSPRVVSIAGGRVHVVWEVELGTGEAFSLLIRVLPARDGRRRAGPTLERSAARLDAAHAGWVGACTAIATDNELFDRLIDAAVRDLQALMMPVGGDQLPAAGIPWYVAPFGRDSLLSACESLMINPEVARGTLLVLAGLQAQTDEGWRDAEPGKIPAHRSVSTVPPAALAQHVRQAPRERARAGSPSPWRSRRERECR